MAEEAKEVSVVGVGVVTLLKKVVNKLDCEVKKAESRGEEYLEVLELVAMTPESAMVSRQPDRTAQACLLFENHRRTVSLHQDKYCSKMFIISARCFTEPQDRCTIFPLNQGH